MAAPDVIPDSLNQKLEWSDMSVAPDAIKEPAARVWPRVPGAHAIVVPIADGRMILLAGKPGTALPVWWAVVDKVPSP